MFQKMMKDRMMSSPPNKKLWTAVGADGSDFLKRLRRCRSNE
jgi:hypothetical protein